MTDPHATATSPASSRWLWLLPALTFLAGCVLAGVVVSVGQVDPEDTRAGGDAPSAPAPPEGESADPADGAPGEADADGDVTVRVPRSCLEASESALALADQADRIAVAVRDLDARRLRELVDEVQQVRTEVRSSGEQCRRSAGAGLVDGSAPAPAPSEGSS